MISVKLGFIEVVLFVSHPFEDSKLPGQNVLMVV